MFLVFTLASVCLCATHGLADKYDDLFLQEILRQIEQSNTGSQDYGDDYGSSPYKQNYGDFIDDVPQPVSNYQDISGADQMTDPKLPDVPVPAQPRDNEFEAQNTNMGYQYMSGGAGEVDADGHVKDPEFQEVKTDAGLPSYCNPPNPCPKGKTSEKDNCQDNVPDTGAFNQRYVQWQMRRGDCACDTEHMFPSSCPKGAEKISSRPEESQTKLDDMDSLISQMLGMETQNENPFVSHGEKRGTLVAKKGSSHRDKRSINPYMDGEILKTVEKKAPHVGQQQHFDENDTKPYTFEYMEKMFGSTA